MEVLERPPLEAEQSFDLTKAVRALAAGPLAEMADDIDRRGVYPRAILHRLGELVALKAHMAEPGKPADYGRTKLAAYITNDYHKPSDEVKADWDMAGIVDDTRLTFRVGLSVANGTTWPTWKPGTEFRARREAMLKRE